MLDLFNSIIDSILKSLEQLGLFGIFLISLIGSLIPFVPLPYLALVVLLAQDYNGIELFLLGLSAGIGGSLGKLTTYAIGVLSYKALSENKKEELKFFNAIIRKYGAIGVFIFALTPLPDDVLYFPLGLAKYNIKYFLLANVAGKTILAIGVAYLSKFYFEIAKYYLGNESIGISTIIAIIAMIIITIILLKIKWKKVYEIIQKEGWKGLLKIQNIKSIIR
jgi:membrane protein DedA with SNARE-associated domain